MTYSPLNINVYTAAFAGAVAGTGIPTGAFITDPVSDDYGLPISVATVFAQAVDTAWGANSANTYDIEAITDASDNLFARGAGWPIEGAVITQANWTIVAVALVAMIRKGDSMATAGGITFPPLNWSITQELWVAASWGSDTIGDGSIFNPFQTIAHAQSVITDASTTKLYEIILYPGEYTEDVALKAFTKIVGFDPTQTALNYVYPADISGDISLGPSFAINHVGTAAWLTNVNLSGLNLHLDFVAAGSTDGLVSITNSQLQSDFSTTMESGNVTEFHGSTLIGEYLQIGGSAIWENTAGDNSSSSLNVWAGTDAGANLQMFNSCWEGDINADQHGNATPGSVVTIEMINSQARNGICTITAAGDNLPTIDGTYGALPENPVLAGSAIVQLSRQMRVSIGLAIPSGTVLNPLGTTDIVFPLVVGILGASNIEQMSCTITPQGAHWQSQIGSCVWSSYVVQNGATPEVHIRIYNPIDSSITLTANLNFLFYAFIPNQIGSSNPPSPSAVPLLTAANYEVLAKSGITNIATSHITGAMGVSPIASTAITGFALTLDGSGQFSTSAQVTGHVYAANYTAPTPANLTQAVLDMQAAYTNAAGRTPAYVEFHAGLLNGDVLSPGVYRWSTAVAISGSITLAGNASSVFIFQIAGALTLAAAQSIILSGGVLASNVFWQVATNTAIGAAATFNGIILGFTDITLGAGATLHGKCLSQTAVNFNSDTLN